MSDRPPNGTAAVIVDAHQDWWEPTERALANADVAVVGKAASYEEGTRLVERLRPDLIVVDTAMTAPGADAFTFLSTMRDRFPATRVVAMSRSADARDIELAFASGASAYVVKRSSDDLAATVRQLYARSLYLAVPAASSPPPAVVPAGLTAREREILALTAEGLSNHSIARQLWVTEQTVKFHLSNVYRKLGVRNRTEASRWAHARGMLGSERRDPS